MTARRPPAQGLGHVQGWRLAVLLAVLLAINALSQIDRILPFILAEAIKDELDLTDAQIGLLTGAAFAVCYTLLSLPLARAADRGSPRGVLLICLLVWSAMTALGGLAASFVVLALTRFGVAVGEAGALPSGHGLIGRLVSPERRGLAVGLFSMGIPLGTMVGFAAGGAMADSLGWRTALVAFGVAGGLAGALAFLIIPPTPPQVRPAQGDPTFFASAIRLAASPHFRWLMIGSLALGFGSAPFYAFSAPFLIRTHDFTAGQVGLAFGLLQGLTGVAGALLGGRAFDRARAGSGHVLRMPAFGLLIAAPAIAAGLFAPQGWMSIVLFAPAMFGFAFLLPAAFSAAHLVAGQGRQALASSLVMMASGLLGPAVGPLLVGLISDGVAAAGISNSLGVGLLIVPIGVALTGLACLVADGRIARRLRDAAA